MLPTKSTALVFYVNGKKVRDDQIDPEWTLLTYLRNKLRLCGTKLGCGEGGCGACTVMLSKYDRRLQKVIHFAVNACLMPVAACHGQAVTTVEGIGSVESGLHPVQERIAKSHGSQCGFCTPGIVMSMYSLLRNNEKPSMDEVETAFQGNLCRCTGYRPILEGYKTLTNDCGGTGCEKEIVDGCCKSASKKSDCFNSKKLDCCVIDNNGGCCKIQNGSTNGCNVSTLFNPSEFKPYDPSIEPPFPSELKDTDKYDTQTILFIGERVKWYRPTTLTQLLQLKANYPYAKLVIGNTEIGVEVKFKNSLYPVIIVPTQIQELTSIKILSNGIQVGASVTLTELESTLKQQIHTQPEYQTRVLRGIVEMLRWFAGRQIRNVGSVGGNIITGSPISDLNPLFMAAHCQLEIVSKDGTRVVTMDDGFFTGYRKNILKSEEILKSILIPFTEETSHFSSFKQAKRRDDDIAIVNAGMHVQFQVGTNIIKSLTLAFGGMAPTTVMARTTSAELIGHAWNEDLIDLACKYLIEDLPLELTAPGGMIEFRRSLTLSFFFKFYLIVTQELSRKLGFVQDLPGRLKSATKVYETKPLQSTQLYQISETATDLVGHPIAHASATKQATGEAVYIDDIPRQEGELYLTLVTSTKAYAKIKSIDCTEALELEGVVDFINAKDLPVERNISGPIIHDEQIFAVDTVTCVGQVIGAIVAKDQLIAQRGARLVKIMYEELSPIIITIEQAIRLNSFYHDWKREMKHGDIMKGFKESDHVIEGEMHMAGQEHFYLETQASLAVPKETGEMEIYCSTQHPSEIQLLAAHALGVDMNRVVCRTKRMGGGFGGKETRAAVLALVVVVAAKKLNQPIRCMLDRDEDMMITGTRHPFYVKYKVGFFNTGKLHSLQLQIYSNAGHTLDLSHSVLERSLFSADNGYKIPNVQFTGLCCKTNLPSNTAFRGFGGPQGMMFMENVMDAVGDYLKMDHLKLREMNLYREGDCTHYNQLLEYCTVRRCWEECSLNYQAKKQAVEEFNQQNKYRKRGLALIPTKFGIAFTALFLNQAGALVLVYRDGSVLLNHGGTEMGQGLHTKMMQIAGKVLGVGMEKIHVIETATDKVPNTSATAASAGSDLNGMAVMQACQTIYARLEPYRVKNPNGKWEDWVNSAYFDRVCLSATGFYRTPGIGFDWNTLTGNAFNYFCFGAACSVVEIDVLTGDHEVKSTEIVMDVGESLNPAIDIGQIEGGFIQGYGLFTLEELQYSPAGVLLTRGPGAYKLPGFGDIPQEFNVSLLRGAPNPKAVFSSKAVGEPPLFLSASVFYAIKDAIKAARRENGVNHAPFRLDSPATAERIRMACEDRFTKKFPKGKEGTFKPWAVRP